MRASRALAILLAIAIPATAVAQRRERGGTTTSSSSTTVGTSSPRSTVEGFQEPTAERTVSTEPELETATSRRGQEDDEETTDNLEETLYLRERPDAIGEAAHEWQNEEITRLLHEREGLVVERRDQAIQLLEEFVREEPETAVEMPDALLRLAELRWELARANYLTAYAAWQQVPEENRGAEPIVDYTPAIALYDRILTQHRGYDRYDFVLYMKAYALTETGNLPGALDLYRQILREFPQSRFVPDAHMALAESDFANMNYEAALPEFEAVMQFRDSDLYDMALFKSAWCLWRMGQTQNAALRFRQVLDLGRDRGHLSSAQRRRLRDLQSEALDYLIQVFTEDESNTPRDVFRFLQEIGGEQYAERVLTRLALTYMDQARYDFGIQAYELLLEMSPADARAPNWQQQIAAGYAAVDDGPHTLEALTALADNYLPGGPWAQQQTDPDAVTDAAARVERAIRVRAMRWHELGQRNDLRSRFEQAAAGYALYLAHFPDGEHSYDLHFYRAEILFHRLEQYPEAGAEYLAAARLNPTGQYTRDSLYNAIGAFEHVRETQLAACTAARGTATPPTPPARPATTGTGTATHTVNCAATTAPTPAPTATATATPTATSTTAATSADDAAGSETPAAEDPCAETDNDRHFSEAIELYVQYFPNDPDIPEILFRQGHLYYDRAIYDPAVRLFGQLLERYPQSDYAHDAGELILDSFNRAADFGNIETWARRLKSAPAFQSAESQQRLDTLILQAAFARGEQLACQNDHHGAAAAYQHAADEFPNDPRARQALYNAGIELQRAGDLTGASGVYDHLVDRYPGSTEGALGAWNAAQMYESIAQFRDAARFYEAYGTRFPEGEHGADALYNAVVLRLAAEDWDAAVDAATSFLRRFPQHESAGEVTFMQARAHEGAHRWQDAARIYTDYARASRNPDRDVEAQTRLAMVLIQAGDREGADRALQQAVRQGRGSLRRLGATGHYFLAQARYMQGEAILARFEAIQIAGDIDGLSDRLRQKSNLLRDASEAFADVVQFHVAEWVTAALFQIGRSYELFASQLRDFPIPEGLSEEEDQAYRDQLGTFIVPIEEQALEAYQGGYQTAIDLHIFNTWTAQLHEGLTRLNDVEFPPLREVGAELDEGAALPLPAPLDGLRRGTGGESPPTPPTSGGSAH
ncbi:MAG: tetratricopeptide repeat protein [Sandaracinus sp.]